MSTGTPHSDTSSTGLTDILDELQLETNSTPNHSSNDSTMSRPSNSSTTNLAVREDTESRGLKIENPKRFDGKPSEFQAYKNQVRACLRFKTLPAGEQQVIWAASFLEGRARGWLEPHMEDLLDNPRKADQKLRTQELFGDVGIFLKDLGKVFGGTDQSKEAARKLRALRQTGSVHQYTAEFQQVTARLQYDENAMINSFYFGLKDFIKDKLSEREDEPESLEDLIEAATKIDDRAWERKMEKSQGRGGYPDSKYQNNKSNQGRQRRHPDAMDWEANAVVKPHGKSKFAPKKASKPKLTKEQSERFKRGECLNCGTKGHYARECRKTGKQVNMAEKPASQAPNKPEEDSTSNTKTEDNYDISDKRHPNHANISWTGCYDDYCFTHKSEKDGSGWYPKKPRQRSKKQVNTHVKLHAEPVKVVSKHADRIVLETHHWRQVQDFDSGFEYGQVTHDATRLQQIPLHVVMARPPPEEIGEASSTTSEAPETPQTTVTMITENRVTINTDQWCCDQNVKREIVGSCEWHDKKRCTPVYRPELTGCGTFVDITLSRATKHMASSMGHNGRVQLYPTTQLAQLPRKQGVRFFEQGQDESKCSSSNDSDEECPDTTITGWSNDSITVRTNQWFEDWCTDPNCEHDAQHQHKYHMPGASIQTTAVESTWEICHSRKCKMARRPHAHQHCMIKSAQRLNMTYFKGLPRQDTPCEERNRESLDAIDDAISDLDLYLSKNE